MTLLSLYLSKSSINTTLWKYSKIKVLNSNPYFGKTIKVLSEKRTFIDSLILTIIYTVG